MTIIVHSEIRLTNRYRKRWLAGVNVHYDRIISRVSQWCSILRVHRSVIVLFKRKTARYHHDTWSLERRKQPRASSFSINHLLFLSPWLDLHHGRTPRHIERSLSTSALLSAFIQERNPLCQVSSLTFAEAHHSAYPQPSNELLKSIL